MRTHETCQCAKHTVEFSSDFGSSSAMARVYCPSCVSRAPGHAIIFELCDPGEHQGLWAVDYDKNELQKLDEHFRDTDDYFMSLLGSGMCGPALATDYRAGGLCRIIGTKERP